MSRVYKGSRKLMARSNVLNVKTVGEVSCAAYRCPPPPRSRRDHGRWPGVEARHERYPWVGGQPKGTPAGVPATPFNPSPEGGGIFVGSLRHQEAGSANQRRARRRCWHACRCATSLVCIVQGSFDPWLPAAIPPGSGERPIAIPLPVGKRTDTRRRRKGIATRNAIHCHNQCSPLP